MSAKGLVSDGRRFLNGHEIPFGYLWGIDILFIWASPVITSEWQRLTIHPLPHNLLLPYSYLLLPSIPPGDYKGFDSNTSKAPH